MKRSDKYVKVAFLLSDETAERMARVVAQRAGMDFDEIGETAQTVLKDTQRLAMTELLRPSRLVDCGGEAPPVWVRSTRGRGEW